VQTATKSPVDIKTLDIEVVRQSPGVEKHVKLGTVNTHMSIKEQEATTLIQVLSRITAAIQINQKQFGVILQTVLHDGSTVIQ